MTISRIEVIQKLTVLFLIVLGLYFTKEFLMPLFIGGVIATFFLPFCKWMESKKIPRGLAAVFCVFSLLLFITGLGALLGGQIAMLSEDFVFIKKLAFEAYDSAQQFILNNFGITLKKQGQLINDQQQNFASIIPVIADSLSAIVGNFLLILVYILGLLYYRNHIKKFILQFSKSKKDELEILLYKVAVVSQQYLLGLSKMIVCLWVMYGVGFSVIGVKNAVFFAVLCGVLEIVPFIGNIVGTTITVLVAIAQGGDSTLIIGIIVIYGTVQLIQGWILEPLIVGSQVKINTLFTIIALILGELLWGIPGIFLAIPLIAMFKIVSDNFESLKPFGFLIGEIEKPAAKIKLPPNLLKVIKKKFPF